MPQAATASQHSYDHPPANMLLKILARPFPSLTYHPCAALHYATSGRCFVAAQDGCPRRRLVGGIPELPITDLGLSMFIVHSLSVFRASGFSMNVLGELWIYRI